MPRRWVRFVPAAAALTVDLASKTWAGRALTRGDVRWIWRPWLSLQLVHNSGATLGVGAGHSRALAVVSAAAVTALVALIPRIGPGWFGLSLMLGGAAGNLASRLTQGAVTDFIHVWFWPGIFNFADLALRVGAVWAAVGFLQGGRRPAEARSTADR